MQVNLYAAQGDSPRGRFFTTPTFHFETLRNAGYIVSNWPTWVKF
jgi:hypothetical protein